MTIASWRGAADTGPCRIGEGRGCDACGTAVVVLDVRDEDVRLNCCGRPMSLAAPIGCGTPVPRRSREHAGLRAGRIYEDPRGRLALRCIRAGSSSVSVDGRPVSPRSRLAG